MTQLDDGWQFCLPTDAPTSNDAWSEAGTLDKLPHAGPAQTLLLRRTFELLAADECINYELYFEQAPVGTIITINGEHIGETAASSFHHDVTPHVWLGANTLLLKIRQPGALSGVRLQAVPCA